MPNLPDGLKIHSWIFLGESQMIKISRTSTIGPLGSDQSLIVNPIQHVTRHALSEVQKKKKIIRQPVAKTSTPFEEKLFPIEISYLELLDFNKKHKKH
jgi:hypothetical protein